MIREHKASLEIVAKRVDLPKPRMATPAWRVRVVTWAVGVLSLSGVALAWVAK